MASPMRSIGIVDLSNVSIPTQVVETINVVRQIHSIQISNHSLTSTLDMVFIVNLYDINGNRVNRQTVTLTREEMADNSAIHDMHIMGKIAQKLGLTLQSSQPSTALYFPPKYTPPNPPPP